MWPNILLYTCTKNAFSKLFSSGRRSLRSLWKANDQSRCVDPNGFDKGIGGLYCYGDMSLILQRHWGGGGGYGTNPKQGVITDSAWRLSEELIHGASFSKIHKPKNEKQKRQLELLWLIHTAANTASTTAKCCELYTQQRKRGGSDI